MNIGDTSFILYLNYVVGHNFGSFRLLFKIQNLACTELASMWQELGNVVKWCWQTASIFLTILSTYVPVPLFPYLIDVMVITKTTTLAIATVKEFNVNSKCYFC